MLKAIRGFYEWFCSIVIAALIVGGIGIAILVALPIACYYAPRCAPWLY